MPRFTDSLKVIKKQIDDVPGLENEAASVNALLRKKEIGLSDVQEAKEMLDDHFSLYKVTGDAKEGAQKEGIRKIREELREFIENEVPDVDIRALNNDVSTAKGISNAIQDRSTRGLTRSSLSLGDLGFFGTGTAFGGPLFGAAFVLAKKVLESTPMRLRFAKWLDGLNDAKKLQVKKELKSGKIPSGLPKEIRDAVGKIPEVTAGAAGAAATLGVMDVVEDQF